MWASQRSAVAASLAVGRDHCNCCTGTGCINATPHLVPPRPQLDEHAIQQLQLAAQPHLCRQAVPRQQQLGARRVQPAAGRGDSRGGPTARLRAAQRSWCFPAAWLHTITAPHLQHRSSSPSLTPAHTRMHPPSLPDEWVVADVAHLHEEIVHPLHAPAAAGPALQLPLHELEERLLVGAGQHCGQGREAKAESHAMGSSAGGEPVQTVPAVATGLQAACRPPPRPPTHHPPAWRPPGRRCSTFCGSSVATVSFRRRSMKGRSTWCSLLVTIRDSSSLRRAASAAAAPSSSLLSASAPAAAAPEAPLPPRRSAPPNLQAGQPVVGSSKRARVHQYKRRRQSQR